MWPIFNFFTFQCGILLLFLSTALLAADDGTSGSIEVCILKRFLPGLGYTLAFVGMLLQVCYNLDQNVYIVNPKSSSTSSVLGSSRSGH